MIKTSDLELCQDVIALKFVTQCKSGPQNAGLPALAAACGQFLGDTTSEQRGLHGTAAAIRVLAEDGRPEARELLPKLIEYGKQRDGIEGTDGEQLQRDNANVIKISEMLFALKFVDAAVADTEALKKQLADALLNGKANSSGWGYFIDRRDAAQLLPTAHAVRALAEYGYDVQDPVKFLLDAGVKKLSDESAPRADISVRVFCLYVLSFIRNEQKDYRDDLRNIFSSLWRSLESVLDSDIEQNIEYSRDREHYYVRVPWQLYLLAVAAKLAPNRRFASRAAQRRMNAIKNAVMSPEGFTYPHSGARISARTNAILYEVFSTIERELDKIWQGLLVPFYAIDRIRSFLSSRGVRWFAVGVALFLSMLSLSSWYTRGGQLGELAPELLGALLILLLTAGKAR